MIGNLKNHKEQHFVSRWTCYSTLWGQLLQLRERSPITVNHLTRSSKQPPVTWPYWAPATCHLTWSSTYHLTRSSKQPRPQNRSLFKDTPTRYFSACCRIFIRLPRKIMIQMCFATISLNLQYIYNIIYCCIFFFNILKALQPLLLLPELLLLEFLDFPPLESVWFPPSEFHCDRF